MDALDTREATRLIEKSVLEGNAAELPLFVLSPKDAMPLRPSHTHCPRCDTKLKSVAPDLSTAEIAALASITPQEVEAALALPRDFRDHPKLRGREPADVRTWLRKLSKDPTPGPPLLYYGCPKCDYRTRLAAHPEDYKQVHVLRNGTRLILEASVHHGFPTMFAHRVLLAVIDKCRELGYPAAKVPITYSEIMERIDVPLNGTYQQLITQALSAMNTLALFCNHWWEKQAKRHVTITGEEKLIASFRLSKTAGSKNQLSIPYLDDFVQLGQPLFESLKAEYRVAIDLRYLNRLSSPTVQRVYTYLTKHDGRLPPAETASPSVNLPPDRSYTEDLMSFAHKLPLRVSYPSEALRTLIPAFNELATPHPTDGKCLLKMKSYGGKPPSSLHYDGHLFTVTFRHHHPIVSLKDFVHAKAAAQIPRACVASMTSSPRPGCDAGDVGALERRGTALPRSSTSS